MRLYRTTTKSGIKIGVTYHVFKLGKEIKRFLLTMSNAHITINHKLRIDYLLTRSLVCTLCFIDW